MVHRASKHSQHLWRLVDQAHQTSKWSWCHSPCALNSESIPLAPSWMLDRDSCSISGLRHACPSWSQTNHLANQGPWRRLARVSGPAGWHAHSMSQQNWHVAKHHVCAINKFNISQRQHKLQLLKLKHKPCCC